MGTCLSHDIMQIKKSFTKKFTKDIVDIIWNLRQKYSQNMINNKRNVSENIQLSNINGSKKIYEGYGEEYQLNYVYFGNFKDSLWDGEGLLIQSLKKEKEDLQKDELSKESEEIFFLQYYHGFFSSGKYQGNGKQIREGFSFEGTFDNNFRKQGTLISSQITYEGQFQNNKFCGKGKAVFSNDTSYQGDFVKGKIEGRGIFRGSRKTKDDQQNKNQYRDRDIYIGQFKDGKINGYGVYMYRDGSTYNGQFKDGVKNGYGQFNWKDKVIKGYWKKGDILGDQQIIDEQIEGKIKISENEVMLFVE